MFEPHLDIFNDNQRSLLPFLESFSREYYLVGGTAVALQIGHRQSIDFDMFKFTPISKPKILARLTEYNLEYRLIYTNSESLHLVVNNVKLTFFQYPFSIPTRLNVGKIKMPDLVHLAAMKAYALGRRAKWKDYVDLYFILRDYTDLPTVIERSKELFGGMFSSKLIRQQLCYFEDIDYGEEVFYLPNFAVSDADIKAFLIEKATTDI